MPQRLFAKLVLSLALALGVAIAPFGWWAGWRQSKALLAALRENATILARTQAETAAHFLVIEEYAGLERQLLDAARLPEVLAVRVYEPDGRLLVDAVRERPEGEPRIRYKPGRGAVPTEPTPLVAEGEDRIVAWAPILAGSLLGWVEVTWGLGSVERLTAEAWKQTALLGLAEVAIALAIATAVLRRPMSAIRELSLFARDLPRRKGERLPPHPPEDEIGHLAAALDHASVELATSERQLLAERERLAVTLQSIGEGVLACDRDGRVTLMNGVAEALTGWTVGEARGRPFAEIYGVLDAGSGEPTVSSLRRALEEGRVVESGAQATLPSRQGSRRRVSDSAAPIVDGEGRLIGGVVVFRDESERIAAERKRQELEAQLRHAQRMEAIGHLAGGIAHDFNNLLTAIVGFGSLLLEMTPEEDAERREAAEGVLETAHRATTLTRGLLAFSRKQRMELRRVDLNDVIRGVERMLRRIIGEEIELRTALHPTPLVVNADAAQLEQVLMNLATNAKDAMERGGVLGIATRRADVDEPAVGPFPGLQGPCAVLQVSDSGSGIAPDALPRIFEPFFTTKEAGRGTGLGLPIVHGIVQQHGGAIHVESRLGIGTTFRIELPLAPGAPAEAEAESTAPVRGGAERILLVEDEAEVRRVARAILSRAGYRVVEAGDGGEALDLVARATEPFGLVISDVVMPRMGGKELRSALRARAPGLPVLFISGYTTDVIHRRGLLEDGVELLPKPFTSRALLERVRAVLDASRR